MLLPMLPSMLHPIFPPVLPATSPFMLPPLLPIALPPLLLHMLMPSSSRSECTLDCKSTSSSLSEGKAWYKAASALGEPQEEPQGTGGARTGEASARVMAMRDASEDGS